MPNVSYGVLCSPFAIHRAKRPHVGREQSVTFTDVLDTYKENAQPVSKQGTITLNKSIHFQSGQLLASMFMPSYRQSPIGNFYD
ncbi:MAG: hypothetical protein LUQ26_04955 [Methylococcaceae bacterium]|nr:hypothetical protein [Methylococcaceae bacterium]